MRIVQAIAKNMIEDVFQFIGLWFGARFGESASC